ncbi:hypothetical protein C442_14795 [Haloarcula amylolytica JCM 13557]|uniref:Uncharacterized protein n=1 Tax=Haloarcula amylolytica JCM 13557 TaxID=1227452 RepID=M0KD71_9EURY|nr:hypothetical protein C442_14795 [Haloarcula amylolytica JCM 13557]
MSYLDWLIFTVMISNGTYFRELVSASTRLSLWTDVILPMPARELRQSIMPLRSKTSQMITGVSN